MTRHTYQGVYAKRSAWTMFEHMHARHNVMKKMKQDVTFEDTPVTVENVPPVHAMHTDEFEAPAVTDAREA